MHACRKHLAVIEPQYGKSFNCRATFTAIRQDIRATERIGCFGRNALIFCIIFCVLPAPRPPSDRSNTVPIPAYGLPYASADGSIEYLSKEESLHVEAGKRIARDFCSFIHLKRSPCLPRSSLTH